MAAAIIAESSLSFLGLGFPPDIPTWGRILFDAKDNLDFAPHWAIFPGTAIFLTVLSINYIGDGLRDALDPRKVLALIVARRAGGRPARGDRAPSVPRETGRGAKARSEPILRGRPTRSQPTEPQRPGRPAPARPPALA